MIKNLFTGLYVDENVIEFNQDSANVIFSCNEIVIFNKDLNNISLDNNFDELAWHIKFEKREAFKKELSEELMLIVWHPKWWCNFYMSQDEKKEIELFFAEL